MHKTYINKRLFLISFIFLTWKFFPAFTQDLEPRAYTNIPWGINFVLAGYNYSQGGVVFDPTIPLDIHQSIKINLSTGVSTRTGSDYDIAGIIWQYRWGKELPKKTKTGNQK
jgi:hypothetical protein